MTQNTEQKKPSDKRKIVWIMNIVVAVLCVLAIVCHFFPPVWQINLTYTITAEQFEELTKDSGFDFDANDVIGEEGKPIEISVALNAGHVLGSFSAGEATVDNIVDSNVDNIVVQLGGTLNEIAKSAVKSVAKNTVKNEVKENVKKRLTKEGEEMSEEEVQQKLDDLGFTDDYISEKTDQIIDDVFEGGKDIDQVTENIMDTVDEVYKDFRENSAGKEDLEEFHDIELSEEDKAAIEDTVKKTLEDLAKEDGTIDPDELIAELLSQALDAMGNKDKNPDSNNGNDDETASLGIVSLADGESDGSSSQEKLAASLKNMLNSVIGDDIRSIAVYVFYGMAGLMLLSMLPWVYVLIKLLVKFLKKDPNPTVKLAVPIWLGWLFFFILVAVPTIALWVLQMPAFADLLASVPYLSSMSFSISSLSCISAICALCVFGISIYYIVVRKQLKEEAQTPSSGNTNTSVQEEVAVSEE